MGGAHPRQRSMLLKTKGFRLLRTFPGNTVDKLQKTAQVDDGSAG